MANTTNLVMPLVDAAQLSKEATIDSALQIVDDGCFFRRGTLAARPGAPFRLGRMYWATDVGNEGFYRDNGATWDAFGAQHVNQSGGTVVGAAAVAGVNTSAGTAPPVPVVTAGSNDQRGRITFGTGTGTTLGGSMVLVSFAVAFAAAPIVVMAAKNGQTQNAGLFLFAVSTSTFTIGFAGAAAASQANTFYDINYIIVG